MLKDDIFYFNGVDLHAATDNHVLLAPHHDQITSLIKPAQIPGLVPPIFCPNLHSGFQIPEVP